MGPRLSRRKAIVLIAERIAAQKGLSETECEQVSMFALEKHLNGKSAARAIFEADVFATGLAKRG